MGIIPGADWQSEGNPFGEDEPSESTRDELLTELAALRAQLSEISLLEGTAADLSASLEVRGVEVQTPEQFAEPPPAEPVPPKPKRKR